MSSRVGRSFDPRKAALALAIAFAAISAGVVLYFVASSRSSGESTVAAAPPTIDQAPPEAPPPSGPGQGALSSEWARLQFVDKKDPTRIASEMEWQSLSPDEAQRGRSHISEPRFWIYAEDGHTIHVQSRQATVFMPDQQSEPESGRLDGAAIIRVFGPGPDGQRRAIDLEQDRPDLLIVTETISFDSALGEITMPSRCEIVLADGRVEVAHLRMNVSEARRRLELLEAGPGQIVYQLSNRRSSDKRRESPAPGGPADAPTQQVADAGDQPPATPREDLYRATFTGRVAVRQASREITGDALDVWARLLDGSLPEGAFPNPRRDDSAPAEPAPQPTDPSALPAVATNASAPETPAAATEDVILTWGTSLVIRPLSSTPTELSGNNHIALRFTADTTGNVAFADNEAGIAGSCVWAGLAVSTQDLTLSGPGPTAVRIKTRGGQEMIVPRLDLNLLSGVGVIRGAGVMHDGDRRLTWAEQGDLLFATRRGMMTGSLREAAFRGNVTARDERSQLSGDLFRATFVPTPGASDDAEKVVLASLLIDGNAAGSNDEGSIRAERIDVAFDTAPDGDPQPKVVTATGKVRARNDEAELQAGMVEATLAPDERGDLMVTSLEAQGAVALESEKEGISATADHLWYDGMRQAARLTSRNDDEPASVAHKGSVVSSRIIELDAAARRLVVPGPGTFEHEPVAGKTSGPLGTTSFAASWTDSMTADNAAGIVECIGGVEVVTDVKQPQVYRAAASYLRLEFEPATEPAPAESAEAPRERRLLRAELASSDEANPALVESRTYASASAASGERRLEQFFRLTGERIIADDTAGTGAVISVPGPGRAAVYDGRAAESALAAEAVSASPAAPFRDREFRGSALFTWNGSMDLNRKTDLLTMRRGVRLVHLPLADDPATTLECERLLAKLLFKTSGDNANASADLVRADATGAVYVESATRRLMADGVLYDASRRLVEATASEGNRVTLYDDSRATVTSAARLRWDLAADRIEVEKPSPVIAPYTPR